MLIHLEKATHSVSSAAAGRLICKGIYFALAAAIMMAAATMRLEAVILSGAPDSFARYPKWAMSYENELSFELRTRQANALLLYVDDGALNANYLCLSIVDGALQLELRTGQWDQQQHHHKDHTKLVATSPEFSSTSVNASTFLARGKSPPSSSWGLPPIAAASTNTMAEEYGVRKRPLVQLRIDAKRVDDGEWHKFSLYQAWENLKLALDDEVVLLKVLPALDSGEEGEGMELEGDPLLFYPSPYYSQRKSFLFGQLRTNSDVFVGGIPKKNLFYRLYADSGLDVATPQLIDSLGTRSTDDDYCLSPTLRPASTSSSSPTISQASSSAKKPYCLHDSRCYSTNTGPRCDCSFTAYEGRQCESPRRTERAGEVAMFGAEWLGYDITNVSAPAVVELWARHENLSLEFRSAAPNALLFTAGQGMVTSRAGDSAASYVQLTLEKGVLVAVSKLSGSEPRVIRLFNKAPTGGEAMRKGFDDDVWHKVVLYRDLNLMRLTVDGRRSEEVKQLVPASSTTSPSASSNWLAHSYAFLGGIPQPRRLHIAIGGASAEEAFRGCIRRVRFEADLLELDFVELADQGFGQSVVETGGDLSFSCATRDGTTRHHQPDVLAFTTGRAHLTLPRWGSLASGSLGFQLRTSEPEALLLYHGAAATPTAASARDYLAFELVDGHLHMVVDLGSGHVRLLCTSRAINDGRWHSVLLERAGRRGSVTVDGRLRTDFHTPGVSANLDTGDEPIYVGGAPWLSYSYSDGKEETHGDKKVSRSYFPSPVWSAHLRRGFIGCVKNLRVNGINQQIATVLAEQNAWRASGISIGCPASNSHHHHHSSSSALANDSSPNSAHSPPSPHALLDYCTLSGANPCLNSGRCLAGPLAGQDHFRCDCSATGVYDGERCERRLTPISFPIPITAELDTTAQVFQLPQAEVSEAEDFECRFRSEDNSAVLFDTRAPYTPTGGRRRDRILLMLAEGELELQLQQGGGNNNNSSAVGDIKEKGGGGGGDILQKHTFRWVGSRPLDDNRWHTVRVKRRGDKLVIGNEWLGSEKTFFLPTSQPQQFAVHIGEISFGRAATLQQPQLTHHQHDDAVHLASGDDDDGRKGGPLSSSSSSSTNFVGQMVAMRYNGRDLLAPLREKLLQSGLLTTKGTAGKSQPESSGGAKDFRYYVGDRADVEEEGIDDEEEEEEDGDASESAITFNSTRSYLVLAEEEGKGGFQRSLSWGLVHDSVSGDRRKGTSIGSSSGGGGRSPYFRFSFRFKTLAANGMMLLLTFVEATGDEINDGGGDNTNEEGEHQRHQQKQPEFALVELRHGRLRYAYGCSIAGGAAASSTSTFTGVGDLDSGPSGGWRVPGGMEIGVHQHMSPQSSSPPLLQVESILSPINSSSYSRPSSSSSTSPKLLNDLRWHVVNVQEDRDEPNLHRVTVSSMPYSPSTSSLTPGGVNNRVDEKYHHHNELATVSTTFRLRLPQCAEATTNNNGPAKSASGSRRKMMAYVGGLPLSTSSSSLSSPSVAQQIPLSLLPAFAHSRGYRGCLSHLRLGRRYFDDPLTEAIATSGEGAGGGGGSSGNSSPNVVKRQCAFSPTSHCHQRGFHTPPRKNPPPPELATAAGAFCLHEGLCRQGWEGAQCDCSWTSFAGPRCDQLATAYEFHLAGGGGGGGDTMEVAGGGSGDDAGGSTAVYAELEEAEEESKGRRMELALAFESSRPEGVLFSVVAVPAATLTDHYSSESPPPKEGAGGGRDDVLTTTRERLLLLVQLRNGHLHVSYGDGLGGGGGGGLLLQNGSTISAMGKQQQPQQQLFTTLKQQQDHHSHHHHYHRPSSDHDFHQHRLRLKEPRARLDDNRRHVLRLSKHANASLTLRLDGGRPLSYDPPSATEQQPKHSASAALSRGVGEGEEAEEKGRRKKEKLLLLVSVGARLLLSPKQGVAQGPEKKGRVVVTSAKDGFTGTIGGVNFNGLKLLDEYEKGGDQPRLFAIGSPRLAQLSPPGAAFSSIAAAASLPPSEERSASEKLEAEAGEITTTTTMSHSRKSHSGSEKEEKSKGRKPSGAESRKKGGTGQGITPPGKNSEALGAASGIVDDRLFTRSPLECLPYEKKESCVTVTENAAANFKAGDEGQGLFTPVLPKAFTERHHHHHQGRQHHLTTAATRRPPLPSGKQEPAGVGATPPPSTTVKPYPQSPLTASDKNKGEQAQRKAHHHSPFNKTSAAAAAAPLPPPPQPQSRSRSLTLSSPPSFSSSPRPPPARQRTELAQQQQLPYVLDDGGGNGGGNKPQLSVQHRLPTSHRHHQQIIPSSNNRKSNGSILGKVGGVGGGGGRGGAGGGKNNSAKSKYYYEPPGGWPPRTRTGPDGRRIPPPPPSPNAASKPPPLPSIDEEEEEGEEGENEETNNGEEEKKDEEGNNGGEEDSSSESSEPTYLNQFGEVLKPGNGGKVKELWSHLGRVFGEQSEVVGSGRSRITTPTSSTTRSTTTSWWWPTTTTSTPQPQLLVVTTPPTFLKSTPTRPTTTRSTTSSYSTTTTARATTATVTAKARREGGGGGEGEMEKGNGYGNGNGNAVVHFTFVANKLTTAALSAATTALPTAWQQRPLTTAAFDPSLYAVRPTTSMSGGMSATTTSRAPSSYFGESGPMRTEVVVVGALVLIASICLALLCVFCKRTIGSQHMSETSYYQPTAGNGKSTTGLSGGGGGYTPIPGGDAFSSDTSPQLGGGAVNDTTSTTNGVCYRAAAQLGTCLPSALRTVSGGPKPGYQALKGQTIPLQHTTRSTNLIQSTTTSTTAAVTTTNGAGAYSSTTTTTTNGAVGRKAPTSSWAAGEGGGTGGNSREAAEEAAAARKKEFKEWYV